MLKVGIIGSGVMGAGIAQAALTAGHAATVVELDGPSLESGLAKINKGLKYLVKKQVITQEGLEETLGRLDSGTSLEAAAPCDLVIEAVVEDIKVKQEVFKNLDALCGPDAVLASNTSSLSISQIASATGRPGRVLGLHFFNPVPVMPLVEVVKTIATGPGALRAAQEFVKSLGKEPVLVKDTPGFMVNLLLTPFLFHAMSAAQEGLASVDDIDRGMRLGLNHPMGPLMLSDFIGLDILLKAGESMFKAYKDKKFAPPAVLQNMVYLGRLGQKTGQGFYDWADPKKTPAPGACLSGFQPQGG